MKILNSKSFIKLNEQQKIYNIVPVTDRTKIKNILVRLAKETEKHPLNYENWKKTSAFDPTGNPERDKLTQLFGSLDIPYDFLQNKQISYLIAKIFYNSVIWQYEAELEDQLYVEEASTEWCDDEPGEPGTYSTFYKMSYEFEDTVDFVNAENFALRTYNIQIIYDEDKKDICFYYDGYTPTDEYSAFAEEYDKLPNDFIPISNDIDLMYEFKDLYDKYCDEAQRDYDPSEY